MATKTLWSCMVENVHSPDVRKELDANLKREKAPQKAIDMLAPALDVAARLCATHAGPDKPAELKFVQRDDGDLVVSISNEHAAGEQGV